MRIAAGTLRAFGPAVIVVCLSSIALILLDLGGIAPGVARPLADLPSALVLVALVPWLAACALAWRRLTHRDPWRLAWQHARASLVSGPALLSLAVGVVLTRTILVNAVAWKYGIPALGGWHYDLTFDAWDRLLHGGEAWRRADVLLRWPLLWITDRFYELWYAAFVVVVIREAWRRPDARQCRFFVALALTWVAGSVLSVLWPSAGPAYFTAVTGSPGYGLLTVALAAHPLTATTLQRDLWSAYQHGGEGLVKGIAAFPSLHVAMPALYAASTWSRARRESWGWWGFTALTLAGSVVLAWHYAVDGYAAILLALACWWIAGHLTPQTTPAR